MNAAILHPPIIEKTLVRLGLQTQAPYWTSAAPLPKVSRRGRGNGWMEQSGLQQVDFHGHLPSAGSHSNSVGSRAPSQRAIASAS
mgnify:CR=1 FL=1